MCFRARCDALVSPRRLRRRPSVPIARADASTDRRRGKFTRSTSTCREAAARRDHRVLVGATATYDAARNVSTAREIGRCLGQVLYVIRCNLDHGEKRLTALTSRKSSETGKCSLLPYPLSKTSFFGHWSARSGSSQSIERSNGASRINSIIADLGEPAISSVHGSVAIGNVKRPRPAVKKAPPPTARSWTQWVISVALFQTIQEWHAAGHRRRTPPQRSPARRLRMLRSGGLRKIFERNALRFIVARVLTPMGLRLSVRPHSSWLVGELIGRAAGDDAQGAETWLRSLFR